MSTAPVVALFLSLAAGQAAPGRPADPAALARVDTAGSTSELAVGKEGRLVLEVVPTGGAEAPTHLELAFPIKVAVEAPAGVKVAKPKLARADAAKLDPNGIRFEVGLAGVSPGKHEVKARVDFAVCVENPKTHATEACYPQKRDVVLAVTVR